MPPTAATQASTLAALQASEDDAITHIKTRTKQIDARIDQIEGSATGPFTLAEKTELDSLDLEMTSLNAARRKIAAAKLVALNNSQAVKDLTAVMQGINANLAKTRQDIEKVAGTITRINSVLQKVDGLLKNAAELAKFFV